MNASVLSEVVNNCSFLWDKTHPVFYDEDARMNRWAIILTGFGIIGELLKFPCRTRIVI